MLAAALSLGLFAFWLAVGYAVLACLQSRRNTLQNLLLAPAIGLSATLVPVLQLNRLGIPVGGFALPLTAALLLFAGLASWRLRPTLPARRYAAFGFVLLAGFFMTGWPMLLHGFEWISYANNDMVTLSNAGQYFLSRGFFDGPNPDDLLHHRDYSQYSWLLYVVSMHRVGNELLLAWVAGLCSLRPDQIYMSLALALHMTLIATAGALVLQSKRLRLAALLSCILVAGSALTTHGTLNQLSSQSGGLALLAASAALLMRPYEGLGRRAILLRGALSGLVLSALLIYYPEMLPFLAIAFALYAILAALRHRLPLKGTFQVAAVAALACLVILNMHVFAGLMHLYSAVSIGTDLKAGSQYSLFPYFLKPHGLAILWGFQTFNYFSEPRASLGIALGGALLICAIAAALWQAGKHAAPAAIVALVMFAMALRLFATDSDFGLFKMAFFIQPFILGTLAIAWLALVDKPWLRILPVLLVAGLGLGSQLYYARLSADLAPSSVEVWKGSALAVKREFQQLMASIPPSDRLFVDSPNFVLSRIVALETRGRDASFFFDLARESGALREGMRRDRKIMGVLETLSPAVMRRFDEVFASMEAQYRAENVPMKFALKDPGDAAAANDFVAPDPPGGGGVSLVTTTALQTIFNRRKYPGAGPASFASMPLDRASDHLVFVNSRLGSQYYVSRGRPTAFYSLEPDIFLPGRTMSGIGRHFLFRVLHPSAAPRFAVEISSSMKGDGENRLPQAVAIGSERVSLPFVGRGSARVFSPPVTPQWIEGIPFMALEMNAAATPFPIRETGLQTLYGSALRFDSRQLVAFAREISLIPDAEYRKLVPPAALGDFPRDLAQPSLEYSGIYEDGWISEASFFTLNQGSGSRTLRIEGMIPMIAEAQFDSELTVWLDGKPLATQKLGLGDFAVTTQVPAGEGKRRIDLRFAKTQRLPGGDGRVVAGKLTSIGLR
jgi:hypothetical protein